MKRLIERKWIMTTALLLSVITGGFAQTLKEFFNDKGIALTYLGVDYYKNRLINDPGGNPTDIKGRLYGAMNEVVVNEMPKNYDIAGAFNRANFVSSDISAVTDRNEKVDAKDIPSSSEADFNRLSQADIEAEVKALALKDKSGIGLVFVMEAMKKEEKKSYGSVWVVLMDMKSKRVLMAERMEQEAAGFGFRNFWVSIIKKSLVEIEKKKYKTWKEKYGS